jgi:histidinol-phosphatase (PHP family)
MRLACYHTHTDFCDGTASVETMCTAAAEQGFFALGFSAHAPMPIKTSWHLPDGRLDEYIRTVRSCAADWKGRLTVLLGLEIDYLAGVCSPADERYKALGLDYSIGSTHYLTPPDGSPPFTVDGPREEWEKGVRVGFDGDGEQAAVAYWETVSDMVHTGGFDIVGHLDLVKKNNGADGTERAFDPDGTRYRKAALATIDKIAKAGLVVEVNTGALNRGTLTEIYPAPWMLRELGARGVRVTINSDAHRPGHLSGFYPEAQALLKENGFTEIVLFDGLNWFEEKLD